MRILKVMKARRLEIMYGICLVVIFGGIVLHAPLSVGLGVLLPGYQPLIKAWKEIVMLLLVPVAVVLVSQRHMWRELARDWIFRLVLAFAALHFLTLVWLPRGLSATLAGLAIDLRYVLFFGLVYVLVRLRPDYRLRLLITGAFGAMVVVLFGTLQLFLPKDILSHIGYSTQTIAPYLTVDKNPDYIRINSTLRGPNPLGAYAVIVLALMASLLTRVRYRLKTRARQICFALIGLCSLVVLWVSYSRSAYIGAIVAVGIVLAVAARPVISRRGWIAAAVVVCALAGGLVAARGSSFVSNTLLHENPHGGSSVSSNEGHVQSLSEGIRQVVHQPLGAGVGSTGSASLRGSTPTIVENQYLFVAHEIGWLGLVVFVVLYYAVLRRLWQRRRDWLSLGVFGSGVGLALIGLLLPVWADDTVAIVWWGLAAIALAEVKDE